MGATIKPTGPEDYEFIGSMMAELLIFMRSRRWTEEAMFSGMQATMQYLHYHPSDYPEERRAAQIEVLSGMLNEWRARRP